MTVTPDSVQALLASSDFGDRLRGINQLRELDPQVAFELIKPMAVDTNVRVRYAAVSQISTLGRQDLSYAARLLHAGLSDPEPDVQAAAADAIGALKLTDSFEKLAQLYQQTPEWIVKFSIVAALGELGDLRGIDLLTDAIASGNELLQTVAIGALGELGDPRAIALITPFVSHTDWQIRYRVAQALSQFADHPEAQAGLRTLATDPEVQVANLAQSVFA